MKVKGGTTEALAPCQKKEPVYVPMLTSRSGGHRGEPWPSRSLWQSPKPRMFRAFDQAGREAVGHFPISTRVKSRGTGLHPGSEALRLNPQKVWSLGAGRQHHSQKSCPGQLGWRLGDRQEACSSPRERQDSVMSVNKYGGKGVGGARVRSMSQRPWVCV